MIGNTRTGSAWVQSAILSIALHGTAVAAIFYRPDWITPTPEPVEQAQIEVVTLAPPSQSTETIEAKPAPEVKPLGQVTQPEIITTASEAIAPVLLNQSLPMVASPKVASGTTAADPASKTPRESANSTPTDPRLLELFDRIRDRLTESCLLALPALRGDNQIQLSILAADDQKISALMSNLTEGLTTNVTQSAVLLNGRQCPGLAFARRDPDYPVLGLGLQLETQDVTSGASLRGRVSGGAGLYNTLLLVDDNGVVHDLRRYLVQSANQLHFDVPLARAGASRDTHQLIVAIATTERPTTISQMSGQSAESFFDQLVREVGRDAMIGISSVYVR